MKLIGALYRSFGAHCNAIEDINTPANAVVKSGFIWSKKKFCKSKFFIVTAVALIVVII